MCSTGETPPAAAGPDSLWMRSAPADARRPALRETRAVDVAVVGAGFTGLSTALHLAEAGVDAAVLEARAVGYGASGRNGGQVNPGLKSTRAALAARFGVDGERMFALADTAPDFLADLIARKGLTCGFSRPGVLRLAHSRAALDAAMTAAEGLAARGIAVETLGRAQAAERSGSPRYLGGLIDPRGGSLQPLALARALAAAAEAAGARIFEGSPALRLARDSRGWRVQTPHGALTAGAVVLATNGYTDGLWPGLARTLLPVNSFQIATEPLPRGRVETILPGGHAAYDSRRLVLYFRRTADDRVVLGGRASFSSRAAESDRADDYRTLERVLAGLYPQLAGAPIAQRWTGLVCITPDFLPHYHAPEPGLHALLGFNGRGVAATVRAGAWLASRLAGQEDASVGMPATAIRPIPGHALRAPALHLAMQWNRLMDALGR